MVKTLSFIAGYGLCCTSAPNMLFYAEYGKICTRYAKDISATFECLGTASYKMSTSVGTGTLSLLCI